MALTETIIRRESMDTNGNSGSPIERVTLQDGRDLVLKRVSVEWDWMARHAGDRGRLGLMWERGVFDRVPPVIDHTIVGIEQEGDCWNVFMRDVTAELAASRSQANAAGVRRILSAMKEFHDTFWGELHPDLCSLEDRYTMFGPTAMRREREQGGVHGEIIGSGWDAFGDLVSPDVASAVMSLADDPASLTTRLAAFEHTLIHGDLRLGNLGFDGDRIVLIDWGERVGTAPPSVELAWFIGFDGYQPGLGRDEMITTFRELYRSRLDEEELLLALIGGFVQLGGIMSYWVTTVPTEEQDIARDHLSWWNRTVSDALDACSLT